MKLEDEDPRTKVLMEALPYIQKFHGKKIVIKFGGSVMVDEKLKRSVAEDIVLLQYVGLKPVVVHGGGPEIAATLDRLAIDSKFIEGLRVTDSETMEVVEMVLAGRVNKDLVNLINNAGARAIGLSGKDGRMLMARAHPSAEKLNVDLGQVGQIASVNFQPIELLEEKGYVPVIAPTGVDKAGVTYNMNADEVAGEIASALQARKLIYLTDVEAVMDGEKRISTLYSGEVEKKIEEGVIEGGMIPKVLSARNAVENGVGKAHIINGSRPHSLLLELLTKEGIGTQVIAGVRKDE